jgi:NADH-quinone oxidoreductase subunit A
VINPTVDLVIQFGLMLFIGTVLAVALVNIARVLAPSSRNPNKGLAYECGVLAQCEARLPYNVHFYLVAVLFVLFDLEIVFLYPWAVAFRTLGGVGLVAVMVFLAVLLVGFFYEWKKGVLDWE